nr:hypothetical protein [uncultured Duganella sp.]
MMPLAARHSQNRLIPGFTGIPIHNKLHKPVDGSQTCAYPKKVAKKEATEFCSSTRQRRTSATRRYFFVRTIASPMSGSGGKASACRFPLSPVCKSRHLPFTPFCSGLRGSQTDKEAIMVSSTLTPEQIRLDTIKHLRWQAKAVANLLSAVHLLPAAGQQTTLDTTTRLADELASDLAALVRGAQ